MEATLIYNPQAGSTSKLGLEETLEALQQAGYDATHAPTSTEGDLDKALAKAKELVVVAGGDGSIRAVATRLLGRNINITPLPLGTANNIARLLGLARKPLEIIAGLADPMERDMDIGRVIITPDGPQYFLEAMGIGAFADVLEKYKPEDGKSVSRGLETVLRTLNAYQPKFFHINVDGTDFSGSYFLCEVMNTPTMGFHFTLAPDASPDDGFFDLVLVHASPSENYLKYMQGVLTGTLESLPEIGIYRGRTLKIAWRGFPVHLDGITVAGMNGVDKDGDPSQMDEPDLLDVSKPYIQVELIPRAAHFLIPKTTTN